MTETLEDAGPAALWHYTDVHGLMGIIESSRLRFGDAHFLNDRTERTYGLTVLKRVLDQSALSHAAIEQIVRSLDPNINPLRLYLCAFSETTESISQWQRYGADGSGYCI